MWNETSAPGKSGTSRTQVIGYIGGICLLILGVIELLGLYDFQMIDTQEAIQGGLTLLGLGFLRRAVR